jgi:hypothetical protein
MTDKRNKPEPKKPDVPSTPIPPDMALELENKRRDKLVDDEFKAGEKARKKNMGEIGFKNGGSASSRADGCAQRGKTRGKMM